MKNRLALVGLAVLTSASLVRADTLVLRSGRRVEGQLVSVRGDAVEFEERGGRVTRYSRAEIRRIEIDEDSDAAPGSGYSSNDRSNRDDDRPSGMRERTVSVDAGNPWTDTGVDVRSGQVVRFKASGSVRWGPGRKDGPGGEGGSHSNPARPMPNRPGAALIGRIGGGNDYFFIGDETGDIRVRGSGRLYLGINDDFLQDNSGSFRVVIYY
jgi:hypothetical protein